MTLKADQMRLEFRQITPRVWVTLGSSGNWYTLRLKDQKISCSCPASLHGKTCYHVKQLITLLKQDLNACLVPESDIKNVASKSIGVNSVASRPNIWNVSHNCHMTEPGNSYENSKDKNNIDRSDHSDRPDEPVDQKNSDPNSSRPANHLNQHLRNRDQQPNQNRQRGDRLTRILAIVAQNQPQHLASGNQSQTPQAIRFNRVVRRKCHPP
ncbi:hypothetical protein Pse7367_0604 [Thalassoporum mexicanum PCC 7367]|uniref:hypothetical protein n=1 Tax=Thalassoporum mexicanum TaxID=3457544 RepID=UPI00029FB9A5|nr:hypothetical protein [Pseudanabaena sp. PCC 7367]AFY68908.1 hypothetical protein Pse7367_0604 [Pseudanabaena sp. PCC 7367]